MSDKTARFLISGRVQGVFFREYTRRQATSLGLTGYAVNLPDGRVEVLAQGTAEAVESLQQWLWQGSPLSSVDKMDKETIDGQEKLEGFRTG